jgi:hypothetical protein
MPKANGKSSSGGARARGHRTRAALDSAALEKPAYLQTRSDREEVGRAFHHHHPHHISGTRNRSV